MPDHAAAAKFDILRRFLDLAREQRAALEEGQVARFQQMLDEREALLESLRELADGTYALPPNVIVFPGTAAAATDDALALDTVLKGILEQDRQNEILLQQQLAETRRALPALDHGRRATARYRQTDGRAVFIDRVS